MDDKLSITLNIAERTYPLKISRSEEEKLRKASSLINQTVSQYKKRYSGKDTQDLLAMASLQFVLKNIDFESKMVHSPLTDEIQEINTILDEYLKDK